MSHVASVDLHIKDLDALAEACKRLGLELVRGQKTYHWYGTHVGDFPLPEGFAEEELGQCEHAIRIPEIKGNVSPDKPYEIGVVKRRDGKPGYTLLWDFFAGGFGLQSFVGKDCQKLKQAYGVAVARKAAMKQGFRVQEHVTADGKVRLLCSK